MVEQIRRGDIPGVQLRCRQPLPVPVEQAWDWLTEDRLLARWAGRARVAAGPDGGLELEAEADGERLAERGRTLEIEPPRRWVLAFERLEDGWPTATRLCLELTPAGAGCELSLLQQGFEHLPLSRCLSVWELYRRRWRAALAALAAALAGPPAAR